MLKAVKSVESNNIKAIDSWIRNINALQKNKPVQTVNYQRWTIIIIKHFCLVKIKFFKLKDHAQYRFTHAGMVARIWRTPQRSKIKIIWFVIGIFFLIVTSTRWVCHRPSSMWTWTLTRTLFVRFLTFLFTNPKCSLFMFCSLSFPSLKIQKYFLKKFNFC